MRIDPIKLLFSTFDRRYAIKYALAAILAPSALAAIDLAYGRDIFSQESTIESPEEGQTDEELAQ